MPLEIITLSKRLWLLAAQKGSEPAWALQRSALCHMGEADGVLFVVLRAISS